MKDEQTLTLLPPRRAMLAALKQKATDYDGVFFTAVKTTGIFCRPSCPSRPNPHNVEFFGSVRECVAAGYRPCKRCHPLEASGAVPEWVRKLTARVENDPAARVRATELREMGLSPERARRWFVQNLGMTFNAWQRGFRLAGAFTRIRNGAKLDDAVFESGFNSHSGFREAFSRTFCDAPGRARRSAAEVVITMIESPLGPLLAGASEAGICLLEYTDRRMLETNLARMRKQFDCAVVPGKHRWLAKLQDELAEYFAGRRRSFSVPLALRGTPFQEKVWRELGNIPHGGTISYDELARRIGQPTAQRAVARANGMNRVCILVPCHRVIGKDGSLTGYGGGLWRKRLLLELEKKRQG
jgi:AraC family transcriptional regulator of adaptative response/methylated-DNA-[protein]-cysteine methyltransferase